MTPQQCRMARAALEWSLDDLEGKSSVTRATIHRFEKGGDAYASTIQKLKTALESSGQIRFEGDCCVCVENIFND